MSLILDPNVRVLPDEHQIFVLHPGQGKRFYEDFRESSSVFLRLPGAKFSKEFDVYSEEVRRQVRLSSAVANWHFKGRKPDQMPSRLPENYASKGKTNQTGKFLSEIKMLYCTAKKGDLIIVPGKGYRTPVLFGEVVGEFDPDFRVTAKRFGSEEIPAVAVKFLDNEFAKGQFSDKLIKLMQNRQAIIQIRSVAARRETYEYAYGNYIWKEVSGNFLRVTKAVIDQKDLLDSMWLTNYFGAQYAAFKSGELENFLKMEPQAALDHYYNYELFGNVSVEVNSPGYFGRELKSASMAAYITGMMAISAAGVIPSQAKDIEVQNSASIVDSICDKELEDDIRQTMVLTSNLDDHWEDICGKQKRARLKTGLDSNASVNKK